MSKFIDNSKTGIKHRTDIQTLRHRESDKKLSLPNQATIPDQQITRETNRIEGNQAQTILSKRKHANKSEHHTSTKLELGFERTLALL